VAFIRTGDLKMNRREAGRALLVGAFAMGMPAAGFAQAMAGPMGEAERRHAMDTLRVGSVALRSSQLAQSRARMPRAREFANFEVMEQTTIADIIREMSGMTPPPPDRRAMAMMANLERARGRAFDMAYVMAQIDGHQELLQIQERYLSEGRNMHHRHIAMLARGQIKEHLRLLSDIRAGRA
jgi:predicted outer membrane protein